MGALGAGIEKGGERRATRRAQRGLNARGEIMCTGCAHAGCDRSGCHALYHLDQLAPVGLGRIDSVAAIACCFGAMQTRPHQRECPRRPAERIECLEALQQARGIAVG